MIQHPKEMLIEKIEIQHNQDTNLKRIHQTPLLAYLNPQDLQAIFGDFVICYMFTFYSTQGSKAEQLKNNN